MVIARPDVNLFHEVAKLPSEVVAIILVIYQTVCYQSYYISHLLKDRSFDNSIKCTYNRNFRETRRMMCQVLDTPMRLQYVQNHT